MSLTADELRRLERCCAGTAWHHSPALNRKPFLVRLLQRECPGAADKVRKMTAQEVVALCGALARGRGLRPAAAALLPC